MSTGHELTDAITRALIVQGNKLLKSMLGLSSPSEKISVLAGQASVEGFRIPINAGTINSRQAEACTWKMDADGVYYTDCGQAFTFNEGCATENKFHYCTFCGRKIIDIPYVDDPDDDVSDDGVEWFDERRPS